MRKQLAEEEKKRKEEEEEKRKEEERKRLMTDSQLLNDERRRNMLVFLSGYSIKSWKLLYRATEHGFEASSFHSKCDN